MVDVVVEFDYDAEEEDELSIRKGDIIKNVVKQDGGWWIGEFNGKKGVFPDNFVKEISKEEQKTPREVKKEGHGPTEIADRLQNILSKGAPPGIQKRLNDPKKRQIRAKAAFSYAPENEDELKLEVGDVIEVMRQEEEGWWEGTVNGKSGVFPSNFVEVILEDGSIAKSEDVVIPDTGEQGKVEVPSKKVKGVGLGNIFANGPIVLKKAGASNEPTKMVRSRQSLVVESPAVAKLPQKTVTPTPAAGPKKPVTPAVPRELPNLPPKDVRDQSGCQKAKVLFSYSAENEDELSLEEGNIVIVLEKELEDSGWWKGELNGKVGVFPDNFVQLLPREEVQPNKPKKPPPPTVSAPNGKATPPLLKSDKPNSPGFLRKTKDSAAAMKKGPPPPPVGKKPQKPADPKLLSQTDDQKAKESSTEDLSEFDSVETQHEKLKHPTASRVKAPQRRPPSNLREKEEDELSEDTDMSEMTVESGQVDVESGQEKMQCVDTKEEPPVTRPAPPMLVPKKSSTLPKQPVHTDAVNGAQASTPSSFELAELKRELDNLKANFVSKQRYDTLEAECHELKETVSQIKATMNKKIFQLMTEIDEEKKTRLNMQVEIDRLKTLVTS